MPSRITLSFAFLSSRNCSVTAWRSRSISKDSGEFEVLIGIGLVLNVQDDRRIQVGLRQVAKGYEATASKLRENNSDTLQRLIVKPSVPARAMNSWAGGGLDD